MCYFLLYLYILPIYSLNDFSFEQFRKFGCKINFLFDCEKITKIFASLESLLNEVVENTCHSKSGKTTTSTKNESKSIPTTPVTRKSKQNLNSKTTTSNHISTLCSPPRQRNLKVSSPSKSYQPEVDLFKDKDKQRLLLNSSSLSADKNSFDIPYSSSSSSASSTQINFKATLDSVYPKISLKHLELIDFLKRINLRKYEVKFLSNGYDDVNFMVN